MYVYKAYLSHLLILSVLRPNLLPLFDVMMDHSHMIFVYSMCKPIKIYFVEFMQCVPAVYTRHVCCVYDYNMHVLVWGSIALLCSCRRSFMHQVALRCAQLGASQCDCS